MLNNKDIIVLGQLRLRIFIEIQECTMAVPASIPQDAGDSRETEGEEYVAAPSPDYPENDFYEVQGAGRSHTMSRGLRIAIWSMVFYFQECPGDTCRKFCCPIQIGSKMGGFALTEAG